MEHLPHEGLQHICFSINRLQASEDNLNKLLSLTMAAHCLLADAAIDGQQGKLAEKNCFALDMIGRVIDDKLYLHAKQEQLQDFDHVKQLILESLNSLLQQSEQSYPLAID